MRSHYCGEVNAATIGQEITVAGWVHRRRDHGGVIFVDLRDREGLLQVVFDPTSRATCSPRPSGSAASSCSPSRGKVRHRPEGTVNPKLPSGEVELLATELQVLNPSETPPFHHDEDANEDLRLRYRFLDLRREEMTQRLRLRHQVTQTLRNFLDASGFVDVETPMLTRTTPEGARDYIVPSRTHPGKFFALPQSPQLFKQLLMMSGFDRYYQIARCFRDEDLRADRQPEFTQLDIETSFMSEEDIMKVMEALIRDLFLQGAEREAARSDAADDLCGGGGALRHRPAGPAHPARAGRGGDLMKGVEFKVFAGARRRSRRTRGGAEASRRRHALAQGDRRLHRVRGALRREGPCLHQGE